jgi:hypothetical protein
MGTITYDGTVVEFDDRTLMHLQIVIVHRFRTGQPLLMSWLDPQLIGDGRSSLWLTPTAPLHFKFSGSRPAVIDHPWLDLLTKSAESGAGLVVCDEHGHPVHAIDHHHARPR